LNDSFDERCFPKELIETEKESLINLDIPIYYYNPAKLFIHNITNSTFPIIFETGLDVTVRKIKNISSNTINFQSQLIEKSLACFFKINQPKIENEKVDYNELNKIKTFDLDIVLKNIELLADNLIKESHDLDDSYVWFDICSSRTSNWEIAVKKPGLYDGIDGIGLFYLYLFKINNKEKYKIIALQLLLKSLKAFDNFNPQKKYYLFSPFNYPFSTLYFLYNYQKITNEKIVEFNELLKNKLFPYINNNIVNDKHLDLMNGSAGLLLFLCNIYNDYEDKKDLKIYIDLLYAHIKQSSTNSPDGAFWEVPNFKNLVGLAHGNSGFLLAISKYSNLNYNKNNAKINTDSIIKFIQSNYIPTDSNWTDLRYDDNRLLTPTWCHGASGISLATIHSSNTTNLNFEATNWNLVAQNIIRNGLKGNHCLCHGMFGNVEGLINIGEYLKKEDLIQTVKMYVYFEMLIRNSNNTWINGFSNGSYNLSGLMIGNAGIGYGLLKTFWPSEISSLLTLEVPQQK
jgi:lantibiotic modifying enzyme